MWYTERKLSVKSGTLCSAYMPIKSDYSFSITKKVQSIFIYVCVCKPEYFTVYKLSISIYKHTHMCMRGRKKYMRKWKKEKGKRKKGKERGREGRKDKRRKGEMRAWFCLQDLVYIQHKCVCSNTHTHFSFWVLTYSSRCWFAWLLVDYTL